MNKLMTTGSLAVAGLVTAGLIAWQAPAAFADHGADDRAPAGGVTQRHGADDGPNHDRGDDHGGRHGTHHGTRHGGHHGHGSDDGPGHDRHDDHGGHGGHGADD